MNENIIDTTAVEPTETPVAEPTPEFAAETPRENINKTITMWNTPKLMTQTWKMAEMLSKSNVVPTSFRGKTEDCIIAIDMANRMNVSPIVVMSWLHVIQGKPSWSGQACISLINNCGTFRGRLDFVYTGEKGTSTYGCYAQIHRKDDGKLIKGTEITLQMAHDEGWSTKPGSKWATLPEQMLAYRAAAFFARLYCPEALMGLQTTDEIIDIHGAEPQKSKTVLNLEGQ